MLQSSFISKISFSILFLLSIIAFFIIFPLEYFNANAATITELQAQINDRNTKLQDLQKEIATYQAQLNTLTTQSKNLQGNIKTLDATKKKLEKEITLAQ